MVAWRRSDDSLGATAGLSSSVLAGQFLFTAGQGEGWLGHSAATQRMLLPHKPRIQPVGVVPLIGSVGEIDHQVDPVCVRNVD